MSICLQNIERLNDYHIALQKLFKVGNIYCIPGKFTFGKDHVTFFLNKMVFCLDRYSRIYGECIARSFDAKNFAENWEEIKNIPNHFK